MIETILKPGNSYRVKYDGDNIKREDVVTIFSIERGSLVPLYGCYCSGRDVWEFLDSTNFI
jgi:hypothetical protein